MWCYWLAIAVAGVLAWSGCGRKEGLTAQTAELEKAFPGLAAAVAAPATGTAQTAPDDAKGCVVAAVRAFNSKDVANGLMLLQQAVMVPGLTPEQLMAVSELKRAWIIELTKRAAKGDESAKAALAAVGNRS
jgi:hypothetical protein